MKREDASALLLGAYQSLLLGVSMKFLGAAAGLAQTIPFIIGLTFTGFALGARADDSKKQGAMQCRFAISSALLGFLLISKFYFLNIFRMFFLKEKPFVSLAAFAVSVWLLCYLFSCAGRKYSALLSAHERPIVNYAHLSLGFAAGTAVFAALAGSLGPEILLAAALALGAFAIGKDRMRAAGIVFIAAAAVSGFLIRDSNFKRISFIWGLKDYKRVADVWSPYYKIDLVTFNNGSALCGLYNYTGMIMATKRFEDMEAVAHYNEVLYAAAMPAGASAALILGSGGGMKHPALFPPAMKSVTAVEIDPAIVRLMKDKFGEYNRGFYSDPRVHPIVSEGRAFLSRDKSKYDFIEYESLDTRLYAPGMNIIPIENTLFTREGLAAAYARLSDNGVIRITIGTEDNEGVVKPIISSLPPGAHYDVYRVFINLAKLTGIDAVTGPSGLAGWAGNMPQTAIIVSKKKDIISDIRRGFESGNALAAGKMLRFDIARAPETAVTDDRPFIGGRPESAAPVFLALAAIIVASALFTSRKKARGSMHFFFYLIGAGYIGLEILFISRGIRTSGNPALMSLVFASLFVGGNILSCAAAEALKPGKAAVAACAAALTVLIMLSATLTASVGAASASSIAAGFLGGMFWPSALRLVPAEMRRSALSSDALGAFPGIIVFQVALYASGFHAASAFLAAMYAAAAVIFVFRRRAA